MFLRRKLAGMSTNPIERSAVNPDPHESSLRIPTKTAIPMIQIKKPSLPIPSLVTAVAASGGLEEATGGVMEAVLHEAETNGAGGGNRDGKVSASRAH